MQILDAAAVHASLSYPEFIDQLQAAFAGQFQMPPRQVLALDPGGPGHDAFALLPAWNEEIIAVKAFTYLPDNAPPHPSLHSQILLFDRARGFPLALVDGTSVTYWRTAGVSALASRLLSGPESATLLLLGTGWLAPFLIRAHASVRPLRKILLWGRNPAKAEAVLAPLRTELPGVELRGVDSIEAACAEADIVVCATGSPDILVRGDWIRPGTHCDFLGNHHADKRECDSTLVAKARVWVDTFANCLKEAGEILLPLAEGAIRREHLLGELAELCRGEAPRRETAEEITLFKSIGCALGDLAGARAVWHTKGSN